MWIEQETSFLPIIMRGVRLVWEIRASVTPAVVELMRDFNVVHCVDLSREKPCLDSDVVYSRLFGKGKHNVYQFTDRSWLRSVKSV